MSSGVSEVGPSTSSRPVKSSLRWQFSARLAALEATSVQPAVDSPRILRFGNFEVNLSAGELRKNGTKLKLTGQPFQVLSILLERPGGVVTREELQKRLWPDSFVDFDHNLNASVNKIREALGDSAESPRFVETLPRRGYRFIAPVDGSSNPTPGNPAAAETTVVSLSAGSRKPGKYLSRSRILGYSVAALFLLMAGSVFLIFRNA